MVMWRQALAVVSALLLTTPLLYAQPKDQTRKLANDEKKELLAITALLGAAQPPANELALTWVGSDLLKAQGNKEYIPFTLTLDASRLSQRRVALYWRVVPRTPGEEPRPARKDDKAASYTFENIHMVDLPAGAMVRVSRSVVVPPGEYDLVVVAKELEQKRRAEGGTVGYLRQPLTVPDLWNGELTTSSVIVAERIDQLSAPLTPAQQEERPYALGNMEIVPATGTRFTKKNDLSVFLLIYNAKTDPSTDAPNVAVEYNFYSVVNGSEKFFNKTTPQALNAQTLPAGFDATAGMTNGQTIPLASFPEGDYRMEIRVTDKLASRSITRDVKFSVSGT
ncbi:MAG: hypothetical protein JSU08_16550 [Acidobacteria bacterium]|nr:hypothetical protein [Acidobacteriota bacterium]